MRINHSNYSQESHPRCIKKKRKKEPGFPLRHNRQCISSSNNRQAMIHTANKQMSHCNKLITKKQKGMYKNRTIIKSKLEEQRDNTDMEWIPIFH